MRAAKTEARKRGWTFAEEVQKDTAVEEEEDEEAAADKVADALSPFPCRVRNDKFSRKRFRLQFIKASDALGK